MFFMNPSVMNRRFVLSAAAGLAAAAGLVASAPAWAAEKDGVKMPDTITVADQTLKLNGLGTREATIFSIDVYVAGLYVPTPSSDAKVLMNSDVPKKLVLQFVRSVDADDIAGAFTESFERNKFGPKVRGELAKLNRWMTDMKDEDSMSFTYVPGKGLTVEVKGQIKGTIPGKDFQASFLAIWLGAYPPNSGLKEGLLGK